MEGLGRGSRMERKKTKRTNAKRINALRYNLFLLSILHFFRDSSVADLTSQILASHPLLLGSHAGFRGVSVCFHQ